MNELQVEVGQKVAIKGNRYGQKALSLGTVCRVTPTGQIVVEANGRNMRFKSNGFEIGRDYFHSWLAVDESTIQEAERMNYLTKRSSSVRKLGNALEKKLIDQFAGTYDLTDEQFDAVDSLLAMLEGD